MSFRSNRYTKSALAALSFAASVRGQQVGTSTAESHPALTYSTCVAGGTCTSAAGEVTIDANWRWLHSTSGSTNCYTGNTWDATICPDAETCTKNCAVDGADYSGTYGITTTDDSLKLGFVTGSNVGSRTYLMDTDSTYKVFKLKGMEFTFDVDVSQLNCGLNGALYFVTMDADGGMAKYPTTNLAGAKYGTGYCDAQCPRDLKFIQGTANVEGWNGTSANSGTGNLGSCCAEMDIWEANKMSTAFTPHNCDTTGATTCDVSGGNCTRNTGLCDGDGCDFNSYRMGNTTFYGEGMTIDTTSPITVVTQFITADGTTTGDLSEIKRFYVQNGVVIPNSESDISGVAGNSISDDFCVAQKSAFGDEDIMAAKGGMTAFGEQLDQGMVLVMSIWDDYTANMLWLDSNYPPTKAATEPGVARGSCDATSGVPATVEAAHGTDYVKFSAIKFGPIGSTFASGSTGSTGSTGTSSSAAAAVPATISTAAAKPVVVAAAAPIVSSAKAAVSSAAPLVKTSAAAAKSSAPAAAETAPADAETTPVEVYAPAVETAPVVETPAIVSAPATAVASSVPVGTGSSSSSTGTIAKYMQCGGLVYTGATSCVSGSTCTVMNEYYSQCV